MCWSLFQLDVKSAFLHGPLEEEVYIQQPPGFISKGKEHRVYRLRKTLYGLRQAPRAWNKCIDSFLVKLDFTRCIVEHGVYVRGKGEELIIICLYVDDLLITGSNLTHINELKKVMQLEFEMTDLGKLSYFLGMEFTYTEAGMILHQRKYVKELLERFNMSVCNPTRSPMEVNLKLVDDENEADSEETLFKQIVGSLRFLCNSRPDLSYSVGLISIFMRRPKKTHMLAAKRLLRYVKGTADFGILFPFGKHNTDGGSLKLIGFTDSDHGGDCVERKSTSGYLFMLNGSPISWCSKKQPVVALSSCEAEYIAGSYAACQGVWLEEILKELMIPVTTPLLLKIDNVSAINLSKNPVSHGRSKHIEVRYHFLRDMVNKGRIALTYCNTEAQLADIFTKAVKINRFEWLRKEIGVRTSAVSLS
ncbi:Retrovirus-related Pol polyprotein from transposon RE1 Retro element 1 [Vigna angularis]|uniref:Retrovirus-related Pol polyprotein from transposon RE1 Retro element 1 n=2 Tax=Phaseolus angularis TaxID=3914 RepID=A0A8T0KD03_PHAAN|nr:Retrovirus-related Pol polyprotein from transposon RE1 Retro element 1 [Vigna angularis]